MYLTKYSGTTGVIQEIPDDRCKVETLSQGGLPFVFLNSTCLYIGRDIFKTKEEAVLDVEKRIAAKKLSLANQLAKLDKIEIKVKPYE